MLAIHWFRRDLRLTDNTALAAAAKACQGNVIPVYILSWWKSSHRWTGPARQAFLCDCLQSLSQDLTKIGGRLIIRQGCAVDELERLAEETGAGAIYFNRDPDPFGRAMEERIIAMAKRKGLEVHACKDVAIHEQEEILTGAGDHYRVFTPYSRAWLKAPKPMVKGSLREIHTPSSIQSMQLPTLATWWPEPNAVHRFKAGEKAASERFRAFLSGPIRHYAERRDFPAGHNNSRLSADLRFGTISIRQVYLKCVEASESASMQERKSIATFINELIWREFYMQILWKWPEVLEIEFNPKFRGMNWLQLEGENEERFERWCRGETGFPIVDAAMRQLNTTGYMHNRLRMIVAMFLTKDLHLDWRHGERYFMQRLIDGDIAANNGGWQWSAGSGADAAPYFRIQNPWTQTARFDPEGEFIRQWVPELKDVPPARFQAPPTPGIRIAKDYPLPMLDHARERTIALEMV